MTTRTDFTTQFTLAFTRLDTKGDNYVLVHDLRHALPQYTRAAFDAGLNALRDTRTFTMDSHDGRHVRLTADQLAAGIREGDSNLVYVARIEE